MNCGGERPVIHLELHTGDLGAARSFYAQLCGWRPERIQTPGGSYLALGLSYFEGFFNQYGKRTMRAFTVPIDLERFEARGWRFSEGSLPYIDRAIDTGLDSRENCPVIAYDICAVRRGDEFDPLPGFFRVLRASKDSR